MVLIASRRKSFVDLYNSSEALQHQTHILPQKRLQSYPYNAICGSKMEHAWVAGDFIVHFPSLKNGSDWFDEFLPQVLQHG